MRALGPSLISSFFFVATAACGSSSQVEGSAGEKPAPVGSGEVAPGVEESAPEEPAEPPRDFQESRRFSPERYSSMAKRLVPVGASVGTASASFIETRLAAVEEDFFSDDWLYRRGAMVLLGEERGRIVAFTQRFYADIRYPDPRLIADGFGSAEIGAQYLDVYESRAACVKPNAPDCEVHRFRVRSRGHEAVDTSVVESKSFQEHDITLLYFDKSSPVVAGRPTMGLDRPSQVVEQHIRDAESLFGAHFNLISDMSLSEMKRNIRVDSGGSQLLIMASGMLLGPIVSQLSGQLSAQVSLPQEIVAKVEKAVKKELSKQLASGAEQLLNGLEGDSERPEAQALSPGLGAVDYLAGLRLSDDVLSSEGALVLDTADGEQVEVALAGITRPRAEEERDQLIRYLKGVAGAEMAKVDLRGGDGRVRTMVVIPGEKVNLNFELLRHGVVRLDVDDALAARSFPELREAAAGALEARTGFARDWREDAEYAGHVAGAVGAAPPG